MNDQKQKALNREILKAAMSVPATFVNRVIVTTSTETPNNIRLTGIEAGNEIFIGRSAMCLPIEAIPSLMQELHNVLEFLKQRKTGIIAAPAGAIEQIDKAIKRNN